MCFLNVSGIPCSRIVLFNRVDARADEVPPPPLEMDGVRHVASRLFAHLAMRRWPMVALNSPMVTEVDVVTFIAQRLQCESARNERKRAQLVQVRQKPRTSRQATLIDHI